MIPHNIEQGTDEWHRLRAGLPTASEFSKLVTSKGEPSSQADKYAYKLAAEKYHGAPVDAWSGNKWTENGHETEPLAREFYSLSRMSDVTEIGFVTDDDVTMGCSPDGLVGDDGMLEIKCLKAENFVETALFWRKNERCPSTYVAQTQGQMMICGRAWCDLLFFHRDLPPFVIRQHADPGFQAALRQTIGVVRAKAEEVYQVIKGLE